MHKLILVPTIFLIFLLVIPGFFASSAQAAAASYQLTVTTSGCGTVQPPGGTYRKSAYVVITATPCEEWSFDHWEGDLTGTTNPLGVKISGNISVKAVFRPAGTVTTTPQPTSTTTVTPTTTITPTPTPPSPSGKLLVGYFVQWGIYQRNYMPKNISTSGSAAKLTAINYAFAGIGPDLKCRLLDTFADYGKAFSAAESVDGVADTSSQALKGNFNQFRKLKQIYPNLKILISIGGWSESDYFSDAALPANRSAFVSSCVDLFIHGNFAPGVSAPTIFDGIDLDWEYPAACGETCNYREQDTQNFTALLAEFRSQLDAVRPGLLLTIAAPAGRSYYEKIQLGQIHPYLDYINLMAYDFHGPWDSLTNHHAPLKSSPADPSGGASADSAMQAYIAAGVPSNKLVLGVPFYGHGWARVNNQNDGLYQTYGRIPRGAYENGVDDYEVLAAKGYPGFWDEIAEAYWIYNGNEFWSFDNPYSLTNKAAYVKSNALGGVMFWELSGDNPQGSLVAALHQGLK